MRQADGDAGELSDGTRYDKLLLMTYLSCHYLRDASVHTQRTPKGIEPSYRSLSTCRKEMKEKCIRIKSI